MKMKKGYILVVCMLLLGAMALGVCAADEYANAGALYQAWYAELPDYSSGVWSSDGSEGNLTFGICADADIDAVQAEILSLVKDDASVSFAVQKYSMNELRRINDELFSYFPDQASGTDVGLVSTAVYDMENVVEVTLLEERKDDPATVEFARTITEKYGDAVRVVYGEGMMLYTAPVGTADADASVKPDSSLAMIGVFCAVVLLLGAILVVQKRKQRKDGASF